VYKTKTLHGLVVEADLVLRARIVARDPGPQSSSVAPGKSRPGVDADVLEVLKGDLEAKRVRFAQHGHGVAHFEPGEETLLFLLRIERSRELGALGRAGAYAWVSLQEHGDEYPLEPATRGPLLSAIRSYLRAAEATAPEAKVAAVRRATLVLLESRDAKLAASGLRDLAAAPTLALVTADELPALLSIVEDGSAPMGVRVGLLTELERRGLVDGEPYWIALLASEVPTPDRVAAIRAGGASGGAAARTRLVALLADPDERVAAAAAVALGTHGNDAAVTPLAAALSTSGSANVRLSAIRALGKIGSPAARDALEQAAESHPEPATKRRALAELRKPRAGRSSASSTE
jgi:hypothetical protein